MLATAMNRSHEDDIRLTRKSPIVRTRDRLKLIEKVWKSDDTFMREHGSEVRKVETEQLKTLVLMCIFENRRLEAIEYLERWRRLPLALSDINWWLLNVIVRFPLSSQFLRFIRQFKRWICSR